MKTTLNDVDYCLSAYMNNIIYNPLANYVLYYTTFENGIYTTKSHFSKFTKYEEELLELFIFHNVAFTTFKKATFKIVSYAFPTALTSFILYKKIPIKLIDKILNTYLYNIESLKVTYIKIYNQLEKYNMDEDYFNQVINLLK